MAASEVLPFWLEPVWRRLHQAHVQGRLPHALLLVGPQGIGKGLLGRYLGQSLLCDGPDRDGAPCGHCRGCHLFDAGTHPDFLEILPDAEGGSREIRIDRVREVCAGGLVGAQAGGWRILLFNPAEAMNRHACNALLKTLEEPRGDTLMLLLAVCPGQLPATVRSRCQRFRLAPPDPDAALAWLQARGQGAEASEALRLAGGAPLAAEDLIRSGTLVVRREALSGFLSVGQGQTDPLALVGAWSGRDPGLSLDWIADWLADLTRMLAGGGAAGTGEALEGLVERLDPAAVSRLWQRVVDLAAEVKARNLNDRLALERVLAEWSQICWVRRPRGM